MKTISFTRPVKFLFSSLLVLGLAAGAVSCGPAPVKAPPKAKLALESSPKGATVTIAGKTLPKTTPLKLSLPAGTYIVKFQLPGFASQWKKIAVQSGKESTLSAEMQPLTTNLLVAAKADGAFGVRVTYKGKMLGETPLVIRDLPMGKGEITLSKKGYTSRLVPFEAKDARPLPVVDTTLSSNLGSVAIKTFPNGVKVFLDDELFGTTPLEEKLEEGAYRLTFRMEGYEDMQKTVVVKRNSTTRLSLVRLRMKKSSLTVTTDPANAKVFLDGEPFGSSPQDFKDLTPGPHLIRVEKAGFDADERKITLGPGRKEKIHFKLDTNMGGLDLVTSPAGLTVYVDGKSCGKTKQDPNNPKYSEVMQIRNLAMGKHTIRVSHKRAQRPRNGTYFKTVVVKKGQIERIDNISLWIPNTRLHMKNGSIIEGRLHYQNEKYVNFESYPGIKGDRLKANILKIEPIPLEE